MSISEDARPREKLLACDNPKAITTEELLAIVLGHGTKGKNVFDLSKDIVGYLKDNLEGELKVSDLTQFEGIGEAKALQIVSALEVGKRFYRTKFKNIKKLDGEIGYWTRKDISYDYYKNFLIDRFKELYRIIKPGGHNVVNISPVSWEGKRVALPFHFVCWMESIGWRFKEDIIWEKDIARDRRSGVLMQHPYPCYYYSAVVSTLLLRNEVS